MARARPVAMSSSTTSYPVRGLAPTATPRPPWTARVAPNSVHGPAASTISLDSVSNIPSTVDPRPWTTATRPLSSGANQRRPGFHSGPANSSSRSHSGAPSRYRFHQPLRSLAYRRRLSVDHSACAIASSGPPATVWTVCSVPSAAISPTSSSVPSHGMRGWSQPSHAARRPSGATRGPVTNRWRPSVSSRTAERSSAAEPSSGTAARTRRTSEGPSPVNSSRTHHTSPRARSR